MPMQVSFTKTGPGLSSLTASATSSINGAVIAACVSARRADGAGAQMTTEAIDDRPEGIARDRWDVVIEGLDGTVVVECGSIRERVSQELARAVFDAVKRDLEQRDHHSTSGTPPR